MSDRVCPPSRPHAAERSSLARQWSRPISSLLVIAVLVLQGCGSLRPAASGGADGPPERIPPGLDRTPDAKPRVEPIRSGGPNKPYEVAGRLYVPLTADRPLTERGLASWYGRKYHGRPTSSGEPYDMFAMTAAHTVMPIPSYARVTNPANGRSVIVRVNDRGPFAPGRVIDLSYVAALRLDLLRGVAPVVVQRITHAEIRAGALGALSLEQDETSLAHALQDAEALAEDGPSDRP